MALAITGLVAYWVAGSEELLALIYKPTGGMTILGWVITFAPFGFVLAISAGFNRFSASTLTLFFIIFFNSIGCKFKLDYLWFIPQPVFFKTFFLSPQVCLP